MLLLLIEMRNLAVKMKLKMKEAEMILLKEN